MVTKPPASTPPAKRSWLRKALLEISIIIVGILLSVAITEWFNGYKDGARESAYLNDIVKDLTSDLEALEADLEQRQDQIDACQQISVFFSEQNPTPGQTAGMAASFISLTSTINFNPSLVTFRALESTGRMELIRNDDIVRNLTELYTRSYSLVEHNNDDVTRYRDNFLLPFIVQNFNFAAYNQQSPDILPNLTDLTVKRAAMNHVVYNQFSISSTIDAYTEAIEQARSTLALVQKELE
ncbi:hypothetical protein FUA23_17750 [Neolewinella aurantiaca]|uniref:Uncharacterized protein n=1 Tax=Neolewinella aurantiaca TaxID=2602767 RepID=A0A5C7FQK7_9BACT|nr:hypothetical protein [Neolewinella aurantiaca]TXF87656.1 hypothetical protein FUA23_17750 [Neolewinella aurantiaca]